MTNFVCIKKCLLHISHIINITIGFLYKTKNNICKHNKLIEISGMKTNLKLIITIREAYLENNIEGGVILKFT